MDRSESQRSFLEEEVDSVRLEAGLVLQVTQPREGCPEGMSGPRLGFGGGRIP